MIARLKDRGSEFLRFNSSRQSEGRVSRTLKFIRKRPYVAVIFIVSLSVVTVFSFSQSVDAFTGAGEGTSESPYRITTCDELQSISDNTHAYYVLVNNIDCTGTTSWNSDAGFLPIPNFTGTLDGRNYAVNGLYINNAENEDGFMSSITDGTVEHISFTSINITNTGNANEDTGGLAGATNNATITNVYISGQVTGTTIVGGLIGNAYGDTQISASSMTGDVTDTNEWGGGLVGFLNDSGLNNSYSAVTFTGVNSGGGLAAYASSDSGGPTTIDDSYAVGTVNDQNYRAGLVSDLEQDSGGSLTMNDDFAVTNSFGAGDVQRTLPLFGHVTGGGSPSISDIYFDQTAAQTSDCGAGFTADCTPVNAGGTQNSYFEDTNSVEPLYDWDFDSIWLTGSGYPTFRTHAPSSLNTIYAPNAPQNVSSSAVNTYPIGFDVNWDAPSSDGGSPVTSYTVEYMLDGGSTWTTAQVSSGTSYEITGYNPNQLVDFEVIANNYVGSSSPSSEDSYTLPDNNSTDITDCQQLQAIQENPSASYQLENDIDCTATPTWNGGAGFTPITGFSGTLQGNGWEIIGLYEYQPNGGNIGLFGDVDPGALVNDFGFEAADITGQDYVGTVAGIMEGGTIENITADDTSTVVGQTEVGGLIGSIDLDGFNGTVTELTADDNVSIYNTGSEALAIGGVIGQVETGNTTFNMSDIVADSTVVATLSGDEYVGGAVGYFDATNDATDIVSQVTVSNSETEGDMQVGGVFGAIDGEDFIFSGPQPTLTFSEISSVGGDVECSQDCGGIVGFISYSGSATAASTSIYESNSSDTVETSDSVAGGLVGYIVSISPGAISLYQDFATGEVRSYPTAAESLGGLVGEVDNNGATITDTYATGEVDGGTGSTYVGGLVGFLDGEVVTSYATGQVIGDNNVGGLVGDLEADGVIDSSFSTSPISGDLTSWGGISGYDISGATISDSLYDVYLTGVDQCTPSGDFSGCSGVDSDGSNANYFYGNSTNDPLNNFDFLSVWLVNFGAEPTFQWDAPAVNPAIATCADLQNISNGPSASYYLTQDIDCSGSSALNGGNGYEPIADFTGTLNGEGYSIDDLTVNGAGDTGIFANTAGATIENLTISDISMTGDGNTGSLAGSSNGGSISDVSVTGGNIITNDSANGGSGNNHAGGLVGQYVCDGTNPTGSISGSSYNGNVFYLANVDSNGMGGLIGSINSSGANCAITLNNDTTTFVYVGPESGEYYGVGIGGLVGDVDTNTNSNNSVLIENSAALTPNVFNAESSVGGLVGEMDIYDGSTQTIQNSYSSDGFVYGDPGNQSAYVGGLVGYMNGPGQIIQTYSSNYVTGGGSLGGLVGVVDSSSDPNVQNIEQSYSTGINDSGYQAGGEVVDDSSGNGEYIGGLVGISYGNINDSYSTDYVQSNGAVIGGLVGIIEGDDYNSYSAGVLDTSSVGDDVGGLVGIYEGTTTSADLGLLDNFSSEIINVDGGGIYIGGIAGDDGTGGYIPNLTTNYYDPTTTTATSCTIAPGTGTEACNQAASATFENTTTNNNLSSWDFSGTWFDLNNNFPVLQWNNTAPTYDITSCTQLQGMNNDPSGNYILENDIDCSASSSWNNGAGFSPIGIDTDYTYAVPFTGSLNGNGYQITSLYENRNACNPTCVDLSVGLFYEAIDASLRSFSINGGSLTGQGSGGAIAALANGTNATGLSSNSDVFVTDADEVGGLFGEYSSSDINPVLEDSYDGGVTYGDDNVGGLAGYIDGGTTIQDSYSSGVIIMLSGGTGMGGLVGYDSGGTLQNTYSSGSEEFNDGGDADGGLIGLASSNPTINNSFVVGPVGNGESSNAALVGLSFDTVNINNSYFDQTQSGQDYCVYFDVGGPSNPSGCSAVNTDGSSASYFINNTTNPPLNDWNFSTTWNVNSDNYPTLLPTTTIYISSCQQLEDINNFLSGSYALAQDIDCSGSSSFNGGNGFYPIGYAGVFTGSFNGNGYTISNLDIDQPTWANVGLFGSTEAADIYDFALTGGEITGSSNVGSVVGYAYDSDVNDITNGNNVSGAGGDNVGGIVGYSYIDDNNGEQLTGLTNNGLVGGAGGDNVGGIVGYYQLNTDDGNMTGITYDVNAGNIDAENSANVGGIIGFFQDTTDEEWVNLSYVGNDSNTANIDGSESSGVGGLIGLVDNDSDGLSVQSSSVSGEISGGNDTGGLIGQYEGSNNFGLNGGIAVDESTSSGSIDSDGSNVGGLVGSLAQNGDSTMVISSSSSSMIITDSIGDTIGGLIGYATTPYEYADAYVVGLYNSDFTGSVETSGSDIGGLVGIQQAYFPIVEDYSSGEVVGSLQVGGVVGASEYDVVQVYSSGNVTGSDDVGGLIGNDASLLQDSFAANQVTQGESATYYGGIVGFLDEVDGATITDSYYDRGLSNQPYCTTTDISVCTGTAVDGEDSDPTYFFNNTSNPPLDTWSFDGDDWIAHTSTYPTFAGAPVASDASMSASETSTSITPSWEYSSNGGSSITGYSLEYEVAGSNDWIVVDLSPSTVQSVVINDLSPGTSYEFEVSATNEYGTSGWSTFTFSTATLVGDCAQLESIGDTATPSGTYEQTQDIDCTGYPFIPIIGTGDTSFEGTYDGNGYMISNVTIDDPDGNYGPDAIFSQTEYATIENVNLSSGSVTGGASVGALVGVALDSDISDVTSDVPVYGTDANVGGLAGVVVADSAGSAVIQTVNISGNVTAASGASDVGGIAGLVISDSSTSDGADINITNAIYSGLVQVLEGQAVGGVIGDLEENSDETDDDVNVSYVSASGTIGGAGSVAVGGIVGFVGNYSGSLTLSNDTNDSSISGDSSIGGLIGDNSASNSESDSVYNFIESDTSSGTIDAAGNNVGGLIGFSYGTDQSFSLIVSSSSSDDVTNTGGYICTGGLIGFAGDDNDSDPSGATLDFSTGTVSSDGDEVGGLIGCVGNANFFVTEDYSQSDVLGVYDVGGLIGDDEASPVNQTYASGDVSGTDSVGGLVGSTDSVISQSFAATPIIYQAGAQYVGGIVGNLFEGDGGELDFNFYDEAVSGLTTCNGSDNSVCGDEGVDAGGSDPSYFFDNDTNSPLDSWNFDSSDWIQHSITYPTFAGAPLASDAEITGTATTSSITPTWSFSSDGGSTITAYALRYELNGESNDWTTVNLDYPTETSITINGLPSGTEYDFEVEATNGSGSSGWSGVFGLSTATAPTTNDISNCDELQAINNNLTANYVLTQNIDCSATASWNGGTGFVPIGNIEPFSGTLDGEGYTISGLYENNPTVYDNEGMGLFGYTVDATISNVNFSNSSITGDEYVGTLIGEGFGGTISNVSSTNGSVTGSSSDDDIGGLIGILEPDGSDNPTDVNNSFFTGIVDGATNDADSVGGLIGYVLGANIIDDYANSVVTGSTTVGGLIGVAQGTEDDGNLINQSYAAGTVSGCGDYTGGLVGLNELNQITDSFAAAVLDSVSSCIDNDTGGFVGYDEGDGGSWSDDYYDETLSTQSDCFGYSDGGNMSACTAVNINSSSPNYFFNNDSNPPLSNWTFGDSLDDWVEHAATYPTFAGAPSSGDVSVSATSTTTSITPTWSYSSDGGSPITGYTVQYELASASNDWTSVSLATPLTTTTTISGLQPDTAYSFEVQATNGYGTSAWAEYSISTQVASSSYNNNTKPKKTPAVVVIWAGTGSGGSSESTVPTPGSTISTVSTQELIKILLNDFSKYNNGQGKIENLKVGQVVYFDVGNQQHSVTVKYVGSNYVIIEIQSSPIYATLYVGQTRRYSVLAGTRPDIQISLLGIKNGIASFKFVKLYYSSTSKVSHSYLYWWLGGLLILLLLIGATLRRRHKDEPQQV